VWHTTANNGSWSITEALATIFSAFLAAKLAAKQRRSGPIQLVVPSPVQALLTTSLLRDLGLGNMAVSTAPRQPQRGGSHSILVVSLPSSGDSMSSDYIGMIKNALRHDVYPNRVEVISVGAKPLPNACHSDLLARARLDPFTSRGDLILRLPALSSLAERKVVPLLTSQDVHEIPLLMGRRNWTNQRVVCLCGPDLPPIIAGFSHLFAREASVMTNSPQSLGFRAAASKSLSDMRDFEGEAVLCTSKQWLLVEPQLGRDGAHRDATLFMRAASTTAFFTQLAHGKLDGSVGVGVPKIHHQAADRASSPPPPKQEPTVTQRAVQATPTSHSTAARPELNNKKHRCRRYSDLYEKRLREVLAKLTPEETEALLAALEAQEAE
jgi:hypothetical protein